MCTVYTERNTSMDAAIVDDFRVRRTLPRTEVHDPTQTTWSEEVTCMEAGTRPPLSQLTRPASGDGVPGTLIFATVNLLNNN